MNEEIEKKIDAFIFEAIVGLGMIYSDKEKFKQVLLSISLGDNFINILNKSLKSVNINNYSEEEKLLLKELIVTFKDLFNLASGEFKKLSRVSFLDGIDLSNVNPIEISEYVKSSLSIAAIESGKYNI